MEKYNDLYIIRTWDDFREMCKMDAYSWHDAGYKASELTKDDILQEYNDYIDDLLTTNPDECRNGERAFTPDEIVQYTINYIQEIEEI